ncbi:MAG: All-trans-phytoene synthase, partial [Planctomycetota bacterium]
MEAAAVSIEDSYRRCEQLARRSASSFYWAFWFLDREQRRSMYALYAFSRQTDDVVDGAATFTNGSAIHPATSTTASTASTSSLTSTASLASRPSLTTTATAAYPVAYPVASQVASQAVGRLADSASLDRWRDAWHAALAGDYRDPLLPAVVDTVRRRRIPPR